ncbi:hypothetical protein BYT27DRAFT_7259991 [Phlegmacium glaucopus]|nr:hypothetical protein BYT27DRAFT_7259991 [Phlegmacium glaucopus]
MTLEAHDGKGLIVYWDYGTTGLDINVSGYEVVKKIRSTLHTLGPIQSVRAYYDSCNHTFTHLYSELGSSGVTVIDCPSNGRKETPTKTMIVDIIAHTWDHPAPRTIVIITGDRDLAYLVATLRLRQYHVALMSPRGTHASVTNQASVNFDWTNIDDSRGGQPTPRVPPSHPPPSPPPLPATSEHFPYPRTDFLSKTPEFELRGMPTRGRQRPHSYEPDVFGGPGGSFPSPKIVNGIFGLGDGPLFARSQSRVPARQVRSDSAPPGVVYSTHSFSRPSSPTESNGFGGIASSGKGRAFPITEPEDIAPHSPLNPKMPEPRSVSVTGMAEGFFKNIPPSSAKGFTSAMSTRSSVTSHDSVFSVIQFPSSSAPAEPIYHNDDTTEKGKNPATISPQEPPSELPKTPAEKVSGPNPSPRKEETGKAISTKGSPQVNPTIQPQIHNNPAPIPPSSSKDAPPPKGTINAQAGPSVPPKFRILVEILRQHHGSYLRSSLPTPLLARDPDVYSKAGLSRYSKYIAAAMKAGLVREITTTKGPSIFLTAEYA